MDICRPIIACYYTDVHARLEASSDMSVFTITARWLVLANFNKRTEANAVDRGDTSGMYTGGIVIEHLAVV